MPLKLPPGVAKLNQRVTNPLQGHWAWLLPPYAMILHTGRRTGRRFSAPVVAFAAGGELVVPLLYGRDSQWVRNLEASGEGEVVRNGRRHKLVEPRVVTTPPSGLSAVAQRVCTAPEHQLVARIGVEIPSTKGELYALRPRSRRRGS